MTQNFFITSTGTEIGKTMVTATLGFQLRATGSSVNAIKPIISGIPASKNLAEDMIGTDTAAILDSLDLPLNRKEIDQTSPLRYKAPLAPSMAAKLEGKLLDYSEVLSICRAAINKNDTTLIEGVGGSFVPLTNDKLVADWIADLQIPSILVAGSYLGTISHTIATVDAMRIRGLPIRSIVISESGGEDHPDLNETAREIRQHTNLRTVLLPRINGDCPWRRAPNILSALENSE
ncbi:dethiobiotin synthase [Kordiimonas sp. SCSIO 12610]|uniref:dethiobiotin synthase n=1 Tax=Kordiimonas sp. SCSIO 12610 TaxID=2829597 RepID=UPI00210D2F2B|nr:dethiobiotin synthase [Kordiimonas sp. SCSIO 12610]UTW55200.1 dethiobiotin synthase [Kordiimonas sp. SCSIO 12610]